MRVHQVYVPVNMGFHIGSIKHNSFLLSVPSAQLQTPVYLTTRFLTLWALLL